MKINPNFLTFLLVWIAYSFAAWAMSYCIPYWIYETPPDHTHLIAFCWLTVTLFSPLTAFSAWQLAKLARTQNEQ